MKKEIMQQLNRIEKEHQVKILFAAESGSRAWGFPSKNSDYDVRFIYVRKPEEYLHLEQTRDVIELPIENDLDINGWDLQKALRLGQASNPVLFEWFVSPIVYKETTLSEKIHKELQLYFDKKRCVYHHLAQATKTFEKFLLEEDSVSIKKMFYCLRSLLSAKWIIRKGEQPPIEFALLVEQELPAYLQEIVCKLQAEKIEKEEAGEIAPIKELQEYILENIDWIKEEVTFLEKREAKEWQPLNELFLDILQSENE